MDHGRVIFNSKGIVVKRSTIEVSIEWEHIELIGVTENTIIIVPKESVLYINIEPKPEIIAELEKYAENKMIIDNKKIK